MMLLMVFLSHFIPWFLKIRSGFFMLVYLIIFHISHIIATQIHLIQLYTQGHDMAKRCWKRDSQWRQEIPLTYVNFSYGRWMDGWGKESNKIKSNLIDGFWREHLNVKMDENEAGGKIFGILCVCTWFFWQDENGLDELINKFRPQFKYLCNGDRVHDIL